MYKSSIVHTGCIEEMIALGYGDYALKLKNGQTFRISDTYKKAVIKELKS